MFVSYTNMIEVVNCNVGSVNHTTVLRRGTEYWPISKFLRLKQFTMVEASYTLSMVYTCLSNFFPVALRSTNPLYWYIMGALPLYQMQ